MTEIARADRPGNGVLFLRLPPIFPQCGAVCRDGGTRVDLVLIASGNAGLVGTARDWHVHEMIFGFLPAVITGVALTAIPNWTDRPPSRGAS